MSADMTYDQLMASAYAIPPLHPHGAAQAIIGMLAALLAVNTVAIAARMYARSVLVQGSLSINDALAGAGYVCNAVATAYAIKACYYGLGTRDADLPADIGPLYMVRGAQLLLWWQIPYVIGIPFVKSAIAAQIMRLTKSLYYRVPLWFVILGSTFNALAGLVAALVHCKPISANWSGMGKCGSNVPLLDLSYLFTALAIVSDFTCALAPFILIRGLNMNARRKRSLVAILSVGVIAGAFTIVRVPYFKHYLIAKDALYYQGYIAMWSMLEEGVGMFAASLPAMHKLFGNYYGSSNKSRHMDDHKSGGGGGGGGGTKTARDPDTPLQNLSTLYPASKRGQFSVTVAATDSNGKRSVADATWEVLDDSDASSHRGIIVQRDVFQETGDAESRGHTGSLSGSDDLAR